jgi:hypothetical protein
MGTSTSTYQGALDLDLTEEISKPIHGSDINTPRGVTARKEVMRLRALLREVYANTAPILISDNPSNAMRVGAPAAATKVQDLKKKNTQRPQGEEPQEEVSQGPCQTAFFRNMGGTMCCMIDSLL